MEYADPKEDTQTILRTMLQLLLQEIARRQQLYQARVTPQSVSEQILQFVADHSDVVSLKEIAAQFSYHPNYISSLLHKETGKTFSEILLEQRMERAVLLMSHTTLPIEEIASMLGYSNQSNFYKAFKSRYGVTPRDYR